MKPSETRSRIETPTGSYVECYPWATEYAINQQSVFWPAEELGVEEDEQDFRIRLNDAERHGVLTAQSIITQYELLIGGNEYWGGKVARMFPRPEIQRMCATFANVELNSHAPFYAIGNKVMGNHTDEFYLSWKADPILADRIAYVHECADSEDPLLFTASLTLLEGANLFSLLGFFKGFNARGHNFMPHFVSGIDGSAKDENYHSLASSYLFRQCKEERIALGLHTERTETIIRNAIVEMAKCIYNHEMHITDKLFAIPGNRVVTKQEVIEFFEDRLNVCLGYLEMRPMFDREPGAISQWFYQQLSTVKIPDFFATTQLQYTRNWKRHKLGFQRRLADAS